MTEATRPNILFIMCDQLRWDYLSCVGHPTLKTPNIDRLAARGVRFNRAYVQSPVCGPSRACTYSGRYVSSHGVSWNGVPFPVDEWTMGDFLSRAGYRVAVSGKTHVTPDSAGLARVGQSLQTPEGRLLGQGNIEPFDRDDGIHVPFVFQHGAAPQYCEWLSKLGYPGDNPWHDYANSVETDEGDVISGWNMRSAPFAARLPAEHSETAYSTNRAMDFIEETGDRPWLLHLSYIKPHWPYVASAPYHAMYRKDDVLPAVRSQEERDNAHPVFRAFMDMTPGLSFSRDQVREAVIPAYMGLITQIDDELGRLFDWLDKTQRADSTVIVFTSDHGDYLGDHWMGEKELFHDASARVPLIIYDPRSCADATRGTVVEALVEAIDLVPSFVEWSGQPANDQRLEGRSLLPFITGNPPADWRDCVFSELDYAFYAARRALGRTPNDARIAMLATERYKYIHYLGFPPQLYDMLDDPDELRDLGASPSHAGVRELMRNRLLDRFMRLRHRTTESDASVEARTANEEKLGIRIGQWT